MSILKNILLGAVFASATLGATEPALAAYPDKVIQLVVPYAPGGINDVAARLIARELADTLKATVVVENRPGANGILGSEFVKRASPDGYTLLYGATGPSAANAALYSKLPYDPLKDFEPVALIGTTPLLIFVNAKLPVNNLAELVALSKAKPGTMNYAAASSVMQMAMEMLKGRTGADITYVAYKSSPAAITDVVSGEVQVGIDGIQTPLSIIRDGRLRAIALTTGSGVPALPGTPSVTDSGVTGYDVGAWMAMFAPAGTPADVLNKLNAAVAEVLQKPAVKAKFVEFTVEPSRLTRAEFAARHSRDIAAYKKIVQDANIQKLD